MNPSLTIQQETAVTYAYLELKHILENNPQVDKESIEDTIWLLKNAFPGLNLETFE